MSRVLLLRDKFPFLFSLRTAKRRCIRATTDAPIGGYYRQMAVKIVLNAQNAFGLILITKH